MKMQFRRIVQGVNKAQGRSPKNQSEITLGHRW
jgi:hypothetical protein